MSRKKKSMKNPKLQGSPSRVQKKQQHSGLPVYLQLAGSYANSSTRVDTVQRGEKTVYRGREYLQTLTTPSSAPAQGASAFKVYLGTSTENGGSGIASLYNLPQANGGVVSPVGATTRIGGLMRYHSRFKFKKARMIYEPRCTVTTPGALAFRYYQDPTDYDATTAGIALAWQRTLASPGAREGPVYSRIVVDCDLDKDAYLYCDRSGVDTLGVDVTSAYLRQAFQGLLVGVYSANIPASTPLGDVYLEYEVECEGQELPEVNIAAALSSVVELIGDSNAGFGNTTSVPIDPSLNPGGNGFYTHYPLGNNTEGNPPPWWDNATKRIIVPGVYLLAGGWLSVNGSNASTQINATTTYSATLSGWSSAGFNFPSVGNGAGVPPCRVGVWQITITNPATQGYLPGYINFSVAQTTATLPSGWANLVLWRAPDVGTVSAPFALAARLTEVEELLQHYVAQRGDRSSWAVATARNICAEGRSQPHPLYEFKGPIIDCLMEDLATNSCRFEGLISELLAPSPDYDVTQYVVCDAAVAAQGSGAPSTSPRQFGTGTTSHVTALLAPGGRVSDQTITRTCGSPRAVAPEGVRSGT